jgi:hypothetical protein
MNFPTSSIGLPQSLKYDLPPSFSDSARAYSVNVAPDGITQVTGPGLANTTTTFAINAPINLGAFNSQIVSFTIPSGMSQSVFLDPFSTTLSFTLSYTVTTAASGLTTGVFCLNGSAASFFDTLVLYSNNTPIETINGYGVLQNFLLQNSVNFAERYGGLSVCMGTDTNTTNGIDLPITTAGSYRFNFTIPLLSVIGANYDKLFPVGSINNLQLQMTTANQTPISGTCAAVTTQPGITGGFVLSEFTLNMKYIDIGDMASQILNQTLQDGKWYLKATTYTNSAVTIPTQSAGNQQLLLQIRNTSVKSILHTFSLAISARCPNGQYDSICPNLTSRQCQVGGSFFPNKPINDAARPSEGYQYLIQSLTQGGGITKAYGTVINRYNYCMMMNAVTGQDSTFVVPANCARTVVPGLASTTGNDTNLNIVSYPNSFFCGYDLEKSAGILFQGMNTRASPPFLNLFIGTQVDASVNVNAWGMSDVILQVDTFAKQITAFI